MPFDEKDPLNDLTEEQLQQYKAGMFSGLKREQLDQLVEEFQKDNLRNPETVFSQYGPGQKTPLAGNKFFNPTHLTAITDFLKENKQLPSGKGALSGYLPDDIKTIPGINEVFVPKEDYNRTAESNKSNDRRNMKMLSAALPWVTGGGSVPISATLSALGASTTETPGDVITQGILHGVAGKFANLGKGNLLARLGQGFGLTEGGTRLNKALNGEEQPALVGTTGENLVRLLGTSLGGLQGLVEKGGSVDKNKYLSTLWEAHQKQLTNANSNIGRASDAESLSKTAVLDAKTNLSRILTDIKSSDDAAKGTATQAFKTRQAELRVAEQNARESVRQAQAELEKHQGILEGHQKELDKYKQGTLSASSAESQNQILDLQQRLDALKNPSTSKEMLEALGQKPDNKVLEYKINLKTRQLASGQYKNPETIQKHEGILADLENELEDTHNTAVRKAIDDTNNEIRRIKANARGNKDFSVEGPQDHTKSLTENIQRLAQIEAERRTGLHNAIVDQLSHVKSGGTLHDITQHKALQDASNQVDTLTQAQRDAQKATFTANEAKRILLENAPKKPKETSDVAKAILKFGRPIASGLAGAGYGQVANLNQTASALTAAIIEAAFESPQVRNGAIALHQTASPAGLRLTAPLTVIGNQLNAAPVHPWIDKIVETYKKR